LKIMPDTNLLVWFLLDQPTPATVEEALSDPGTDRYLSAVSVVEIYRHWRSGVIHKDPDEWLFLALPDWNILPVTVEIARQSVLFPWKHRDPGDRMLAATAKLEGVELWHTDTILKGFKDFPGRYFKAPSAARSAT